MALFTINGDNFTHIVKNKVSGATFTTKQVNMTGTSYNLKVTATTGYIITEFYRMVDDGWGDTQKTNYPISSDGATGETDITLTPDDSTVDVYVITKPKPVTPPPPEIVNGKLTINGQNIEVICTKNNQNVSIKINSENILPIGEYAIIIKSIDGYVITRIIESDNSGWDNDKELTIINNGTSSDKIIFNVTSKDSYMALNVTTTEKQPDIPEENPAPNTPIFNKLYNVSDEQLKQLSKERFEFSLVGSDNPQEIDLGNYIINILEIPFKIPTDLLGVTTNILLGKYPIQTKSTPIITDEIHLNIGNIEVPFKYNNYYDFNDVETILYLPYIDSIELNPQYIIGQTIKISYVIDLYTGHTTVNIISSKTDTNIYSNVYNIGRDIPFLTSQHKVQNNISNTKSVKNLINNAYVEVKRNKTINNVYDNEIIEYGTLKDVSGYITIEDIQLKTTATSKENDSIITLLRNGVHINE